VELGEVQKRSNFEGNGRQIERVKRQLLQFDGTKDWTVNCLEMKMSPFNRYGGIGGVLKNIVVTSWAVKWDG